MTNKEVKEKATELIEKFKPHTDCAGDSAIGREATQIQLDHAKQCAIIACEEVIQQD